MAVVNLANLNGSNGFRLDGIAEGDNSGVSVNNAGDINGDGFDDLIVGASGADPHGENSGSSYVVFGKVSGFDAAMDLAILDGSNGFRLDGVAEGDYSGELVSTAGDVNGDGYDDLLISTFDNDPFSHDPHSSYVVFGKASGFDATMDLSNLNGNDGFRLDGNIVGELSNAEDINGDGFDDLILGDTTYDSNYFTDVSTGYVIFGKGTGFSPTIDLSDLDGNNGFHIEVFAWSGEAKATSVSNAGDINGDGFDDFITGILISSPYDDTTDETSCYVVFGKSTGFDAEVNLSELNGSNGFGLEGVLTGFYDREGFSVSTAGDINGDGFDDLMIGAANLASSYVIFGKSSGFDASIDLSDLDGNNGFRLQGETSYDFPSNWGTSVSTAGDVNGDGFDDLIIGASYADGNAFGSSYVIFGKNSEFDAVVDLSSLNSNEGFHVDGLIDTDRLGHSVSTAGDVNNDGFDDLIVGVPGADPNGDRSGSSYVIFGRADFNEEKVISGTPGRDNLKGTSAAERFEAGAGNDRMTGNGGADVYHGDAGNDYIRVRDLNFQLADGGKGYDTLGLGGRNINLDLTGMRDKISGIEAIYLYGSGDNTLTLNATAVLNASNTTNTLRVLGNAGDKIVGLSSGWEDGGIHGGEHVYTSGQATLLVGVHVATDFA
jgi:hypothetical protein